MTYFEDRREQRETTYIYRTLIRSLYEEQCPPALPPIQVTRNKQLHILTIFVSVSLDTGFLASVVKHLRVVLSFNARKAIAQYLTIPK